MKRDEVFVSKYVKCEDLGGKPVVVTITAADLEILKTPDGKEAAKTVLRFKGGTKALPLNMTNWDSVADALGEDDTDQWPGGKIELYPARTTMGGKTVDCIRVRAPSGVLPLTKKAALKAVEEPPTPSPEDYGASDEAPF